MKEVKNTVTWRSRSLVARTKANCIPILERYSLGISLFSLRYLNQKRMFILSKTSIRSANETLKCIPDNYLATGSALFSK